MTINPHLTDQMLAIADEKGKLPIDFAPEIVRSLRETLPGVDERLLGEIVLHIATHASRVSMVLEQMRRPDINVAAFTVVTVANAGALLYTGSAL